MAGSPPLIPSGPPYPAQMDMAALGDAKLGSMSGCTVCARRGDVDAIGPAPKADVPPTRALRECVKGIHWGTLMLRPNTARAFARSVNSTAATQS